MPPKKKVIKEKKQKKIQKKQIKSQKQNQRHQSQSQNVIINLSDVNNKTKQKRTRKKVTNKNIKFDDISTKEMPAGWAKYGAPDEREINTLKGKLIDVENKLLTNKPVENPVNNTERDRILKIEEGMKNMFVIGNNAIHDLYSKFDQIGDFSNKTKFRNPVKEEEKQQSQRIYNIEKDSSTSKPKKNKRRKKERCSTISTEL
jgi:hypothetical protein